jgi:MFS family permease
LDANRNTSVSTGPAPLRRNRDFVLLLAGQVVSLVGDSAYSFALPLVVLAVTGSPAQAGLVTGLHTVAFLVLGPVAGAVADRYDRKIVMICCDLGRAVLSAGVGVALAAGVLPLVALCAAAVLTGALTTAFTAANTAALPNIVGSDQLPAALGYSQSTGSVIRILGATIAGGLYSLGRVIPFAANAMSFLVSAASLRLLRVRFQEERQAGRGSLPAEIRAGIGWLWRQPVLRFLTATGAADSLRYGAGYLIIIMLARQVGAGPAGIGLIFSGAGLGATIGALLAPRMLARLPVGRLAIATLWLEAAAFPLYAVAPTPLLLGAVAAAESVLAPVYAIAMTSYRLSLTPDELRGRTTSTVNALTTGAMSVGTMLGGALLELVGAVPLVLACTGWLLALAVLTTAHPGVRQSGGVGAQGGSA